MESLEKGDNTEKNEEIPFVEDEEKIALEIETKVKPKKKWFSLRAKRIVVGFIGLGITVLQLFSMLEFISYFFGVKLL